ncbi:Elongation factor Tu GTP binding domain family protein [Candida albicans]|uniref:Eukaryotic peptide chain release factor GTP-binding subunit n=1 Tax=Candida albicans TaxID=5476 RepID=A0A8H6BTG1_CANAX|nr:Elongation factor Tu GTP binding domain family protein [Candida albicans]
MANASLNGDQSKQQQQQQQQQQQNYYNPNAAQSFVPQGGYQQFQQFQPQQQQQQYGGYNQYNQYQGGYNQNQQYGGYQQYNSQPQQQQQQQSQAVKKTLKLAGSSGIKLANATKKVDTTSKPQSKESSPAPAPAPAAFASQEEKKEEKEAAAATPETKKETSAPAETKKEATPTPAAKKESTPTPAAATKKECSCKEQEDEIDEEVVKDMFGGKDHVSIIFMGHVDAGKSTMGGNILYLTGSVDKRTVEKYEREAKDAGRQGWYLSWVMDTNKEERNDGKTIEVGKAYFETDKRRYTILDAPGHKMYVSEMIGGASQADVGILVISARKGEYETGFEKGGQTREHALLAKTQGVNKIIVVVNKMDDSTVGWSKERYQECTTKLGAFLKGIGYAKDDIIYMPVSGYTGAGLKDRVDPKDCPWYDGPSLLEYLDNMDTMNRKINGPFMMPVSGKMKDLGTIVEGKIESGHVKKGTNLIMMPNKTPIEVLTIFNETEQECDTAFSGEQVRLKIKGIEEEDLQPGYVLTSPKNPVKTVTRFEAQIAIVELKSILSNGFSCVMHLHTAIEEVKFIELKHKLEKGTNRKSKKPPAFAKKGMKIIAILEVGELVCAETYKDYPQLGSLL